MELAQKHPARKGGVWHQNPSRHAVKPVLFTTPLLWPSTWNMQNGYFKKEGVVRTLPSAPENSRTKRLRRASWIEQEASHWWYWLLQFPWRDEVKTDAIWFKKKWIRMSEYKQFLQEFWQWKERSMGNRADNWSGIKEIALCLLWERLGHV